MIMMHCVKHERHSTTFCLYSNLLPVRFSCLQVVFATPGMLHAGQSLQIFKKWADDEKNMVYLPSNEMHIIIIIMVLLINCNS